MLLNAKIFAIEFIDFIGFRLPASGVRCPVSGVRLPVSGIRYPASGIQHPVSGIRNPVINYNYIRFRSPRSCLCNHHNRLRNCGDEGLSIRLRSLREY